MDWKTGFYAAVRDYLGLPGNYKVVGVSEDTPSAYFCDTCGPDSVKTIFYYEDENGHVHTDQRYISMADFMDTLL